MKNRNLGIILSLFVFLAAQALGIAHAAAFGPGKHKHHGHICDIYLSTDQAKAAAPPPPVLHVPGHSGFTFVPPVSIEFLAEEYPSAFPRAPPASLLS
ncbi:MAG: hypothetical protein Q7N95_11840 [Alphaproteobacteria bacterium]|nr:hypothetical protein [Alphaproteobacteria bacterium]